jgi:hypothetical protein
MIVGLYNGYCIDCYCDSPLHNQYIALVGLCGEFIGQSRTDCLKQARKAGWKINLKKDTCFCPEHIKEKRVE